MLRKSFSILSVTLVAALTGCVAIPEPSEMDSAEQREWMMRVLEDRGYDGEDIEEQRDRYLDSREHVCSHASEWHAENPQQHEHAYWDYIESSYSGDLANELLHQVAYETECPRFKEDFQDWLDSQSD